jgi:hypothetical protein
MLARHCLTRRYSGAASILKCFRTTWFQAHAEHRLVKCGLVASSAMNRFTATVTIPALLESMESVLNPKSGLQKVCTGSLAGTVRMLVLQASQGHVSPKLSMKSASYLFLHVALCGSFAATSRHSSDIHGENSSAAPCRFPNLGQATARV